MRPKYWISTFPPREPRERPSDTLKGTKFPPDPKKQNTKGIREGKKRKIGRVGGVKAPPQNKVAPPVRGGIFFLIKKF